MHLSNHTPASGAWPDWGRPGPKPGLKAVVIPTSSQAMIKKETSTKESNLFPSH